ncbi:MAG: hypothetical protein EOM02_13470 [Synergistales bacterium]|nr:hypothetical protein [Synergistales bacterium]
MKILKIVLQFIDKLLDLANKAGGEPPKPEGPDSSFLDGIRLLGGNEQLLALYDRRDEIGKCIDSWAALAEKIDKRWHSWTILSRLIGHSRGIDKAQPILDQVKVIRQQRQLLEEPDPLLPLIANLTQILRERLNELDELYSAYHSAGVDRLKCDINWQQLEQEPRYKLMSSNNLDGASRPKVEVQSTEDILDTLDSCSLSMFEDRVAAMSSRFDDVAAGAAKMCEPKAQVIPVPRRTLKTSEDIDVWLEEVREQFELALLQGPIVIR